MDGFLILAIETATPCGSVSLSRGRGDGFQLIAEAVAQPGISHSRRLLGSIKWVMAAAALSWQEIDAVAVSLGPGSFTGLRIGLAAAKAVCMAEDLPLVGVGTLEALALGAGTGKGLVCALLDARKQEVYGCLFRIGADGLPAETGEPRVCSPAALLAGINEPVLLTGPGARVYREELAASQWVRFQPDFLGGPRASRVGLIGAERFSRGETLDPVTAAPLYVRAPEAEINLRRKREAGA